MAMAPPITLAFFTDSLEPSGVGEVISLLCRALPTDRYRRILICPDVPSADCLEQRCAGVAAVRRLTVRDDGYLPELADLVRFLQAEQVQVLHNHIGATWEGDWGTAAARMAGVPVVVTTEHLPCVIDRPSQRWFKRRINQLADRVIAVSESVRRTLIQAGIAAPEQTTTIRNGIELARFKVQGSGFRGQGSVPAVPNCGDATRPMARPGTVADLTPDPWPLTPDPCLIGTIGRMTEQKGHLHLLRAVPAVVARHPEARFVWIGDGPERAALEEEARRLGVQEQIWWIGRQPEAWRWLSRFAFTVLPSLFEGLPLVALESMAAGRAVVGARVCGIQDAVRHGETGLLVPPRDPTALARAILRLLDDPEACARMGRTARACAESEFSCERMAREHDQLYRRLLCANTQTAARRQPQRRHSTSPALTLASLPAE